MKNTFLYIQCQSCHYINKVPSLKSIKLTSKIRCPFCNRLGDNAIWPSIEVLELIKMALNLDVSKYYKKNISFVIVASSLELMLEKLISTFVLPDIMPDHVSISIITEALLDGYQGRYRLLSLIKKLGYDSFSDGAKKHGKSNFMKQWDIIASNRNQFVHGKIEKVEKQELSVDSINIEEFVSDAFLIFMEINNSFIKKHFENTSKEYLIL